jgi:hypothetical protein
MALQPHVNGEAAVMLVVVGDVLQQHGPADVSVDAGQPRARRQNWVVSLQRANRFGERSLLSRMS